MDLEWTKFTLSAALRACTALAATIGGTQLHSIIVRTGFDSNIFVSTALTDLYAKSGCIKEAWNVFSITEEKSIVLWNAMIAGFSRHARCLETMMLFEKMRSTSISPNEVTFVSEYLGKGVLKAVQNVNAIIGPALIGKDPTEQTQIDTFIVQELDGTSNRWKWCSSAGNII